MELLCAELLADATEAAGDADHLVALLQQELRQARTVLPGAATCSVKALEFYKPTT